MGIVAWGIIGGVLLVGTEIFTIWCKKTGHEAWLLEDEDK